MDLDPALQTFLAESRELLDEMEEALLQLEAQPMATEGIGPVFRAAHTIKGTAGLFGFDQIVAFTHKLEHLLEDIREETIQPDAEHIALLLASCDCLRSLVGAAATGQGVPPAVAATVQTVLARLEKPSGHVAGDAPPSIGPNVTAPAPHADAWHISLRCAPDFFRNGMDLLPVLHGLRGLGEIVQLATITDALPSVEEMNPETCYLGFEITLKTRAAKEAIEEVFEFVRGDCVIRMVPPQSKMSEYVRLIEELPESAMRLGEILVKSGALTQAELAQGLRRQLTEATVASSAGVAEVCTKKLGEILVSEGVVNPSIVRAALDKQQRATGAKAESDRFLRVDADKLDQLITLVGELIVAGAGMQLLAKQPDVGNVQESAATVSRLLDEVRHQALGLRMVPIEGTFKRLHRVVHDVSRELAKEIELVITGGETELDKAVVDRLGDPLLHLVRNAMDHGIESKEVRLAAGKPVKAHVVLNAYHDSGSIIIEVSDDGGGLDRDRILKKAGERGLISVSQVLTESEIFNLIFEPGFSTAEHVSNLSGRGVGMDVVKRTIDAMRGTVELLSRRGAGTTVRIRLPLTLAIIDGFLLGVGTNRYVVPLDVVQECVDMPEAERSLLRGAGYLSLRGQVLPYVRLRTLFKLNGRPRERESVVVVQCGGQKVGLVVDMLLGEFQTVIKPLDELFGHLKGFSGFTILGSGDVALIMDVPALVQVVLGHAAGAATVRISVNGPATFASAA